MVTVAETKKKAPKTQEEAQEGSCEERAIDAIKKTFPNEEGQISIRHLWTSEGVHRFRVNWWSLKEGAIKRSEFVRVIEKGKELTVRIVKNDDKPSL